MPFERYIRDDYFKRFLTDFRFLFERAIAEHGEYDIRLRKDYFNVYYQGNSLAMVEVKRDPYKIKIHSKFADGVFDPKRFASRSEGDSLTYRISAGRLASFFSKTNVKKLARAIALRNYSEEITFEQMLITDNISSKEIVFIDRQVTGGGLGRKTLDLLALVPIGPNSDSYQFLVVEVKLGNNSELSGDVGDQLLRYLACIEEDFDSFAFSYKKQYEQFREMGFMRHLEHDKIRIERPMMGCVAVGGYSGIARISIDCLPTQEQADEDAQLALYQIGVEGMWDDVEQVDLVWHYVRFDKEIRSKRTPEQLDALRQSRIAVIDDIESRGKDEANFPTRPSRLCDWCDFRELCPATRHAVAVQALPPKEFKDDMKPPEWSERRKAYKETKTLARRRQRAMVWRGRHKIPGGFLSYCGTKRRRSRRRRSRDGRKKATSHRENGGIRYVPSDEEFDD